MKWLCHRCGSEPDVILVYHSLLYCLSCLVELHPEVARTVAEYILKFKGVKVG